MDKFRRIFSMFIILSFVFGIPLFQNLSNTQNFNAIETPEYNNAENNNINTQILIKSLNTIPSIGNYQFGIKGYKLNFLDKESLKWNTSSQMSLEVKNESINIFIDSAGRNFSFNSLYAIANLFTFKNGYKYLIYTLDDYEKGFFMQIKLNNTVTLIDLAFDGGDSQYVFQNILNKGYQTNNFILSNKITEHQVLGTLKNQSDSGFSLPKNSEDIVSSLNSSLTIYKAKDPVSSTSSSHVSNFKVDESNSLQTVPVYNYGIAHEKADDPNVNLAETLASGYWIPDTSIQYGIYRSNPSESQMKSDLQFYNKDFLKNGGLSGGSYKRNVLAYAIYAHGSDSPTWLGGCYTCWVTDDFLGTPLDWFTPQEMSSLWYYYYDGSTDTEIDIHPTGMIILATVCYGYWSSNDHTPYMANAFVNNGASAFVGSTEFIPYDYNDLYTRSFWQELTYYNSNVKTSAQAYVSGYNAYFDPDWTYGTHERVAGSESAYLP